MDILRALKSLYKDHRSSVMTPMVWLLVLIATLAVFGFSYGDALFRVVSLCLLTVGFLAYISCYVYFMLKDPSRLHSESHIYAMQKLEIEAHRKGVPMQGGPYRELPPQSEELPGAE